MTAPLARFLGRRLRARPGSCSTARRRSKERQELVDAFPERGRARRSSSSRSRPAAPGSTSPPPRTSIHFDRWWNPAVENQATDRAYRIGQKQERARAQVRLPRHRRGADRRAHRVEASSSSRRAPRRRRRGAADRDERRRSCCGWCRLTSTARFDEGVRRRWAGTGWRRLGSSPYVSVAERRRERRKRDAAKLAEEGPRARAGRDRGAHDRDHRSGARPGATTSRRYSDFANRLPRGRTYVRNGSVVDLQIEPGRVKALVQRHRRSTRSTIAIEPAATSRAGQRDRGASARGQIDSLVELLQGRSPRRCHGGHDATRRTGPLPRAAARSR